MSPTIDGEVAARVVVDDRNGVVGDLLERVALRRGVDHGTVVSGVDGYRASIPLDDLRRGVLENGRLTIPGGRTLCWNVKDVVRIELSAGKQPDDVPEDPPH